MVAFLLRMPAGIPGDVNRAEHAVVEPQVITASTGTNPPTFLGQAIQIDAVSGQVRAPNNTDTGIYGFLVRAFPVQENTQSPVLGSGTPPTSGACSVLKRGYMSVTLQAGAAVKDGPVYVSVAGTGGDVLGGVYAAAGSGRVALLNAYFTGPADANAITEIAIGIPRNI
jgi:hypothetical protein